MPTAPGIIVMVPTSRGLLNVLIDLNTGERMEMKSRTLKSIFKNDTEILNKFKPDKNKKNKLTEYLIEYSLKHKNEIETHKEDLTTGDINGFLIKNSLDSTFDVYYNRIIKSLEKSRTVTKVELWHSTYGNGTYRFIGLSAIHKLGSNDTYSYKIGYWRYFYPNGEIKKEIMYDLNEEKIYERAFEQKMPN